jgi:hypothetical protein
MGENYKGQPSMVPTQPSMVPTIESTPPSPASGWKPPVGRGKPETMVHDRNGGYVKSPGIPASRLEP